jgi:hypothetical protein
MQKKRIRIVFPLFQTERNSHNLPTAVVGISAPPSGVFNRKKVKQIFGHIGDKRREAFFLVAASGQARANPHHWVRRQAKYFALDDDGEPQ